IWCASPTVAILSFSRPEAVAQLLFVSRGAGTENDYSMHQPMKKRILILGAGFGGLELSTMLSEAFGDGIEVTLIDKNDSFYFGYSKLDVMFGHAKPNAVRLPYKTFVKPGVRLLRETISSVDPLAKRVTTNRGVHEAEFLVVALGADYNFAATPGMADATEFYT